MNADGSKEIGLFADPQDDLDPAWFPSGRRIAFSSDRHNPEDAYDIYTLTLDAAENVTTWPPSASLSASRKANTAARGMPLSPPSPPMAPR
jgi:Tol biopolymer transport system component